MINTAIIGIGRLGSALASCLPRDRYRITHLIDRHPSTVRLSFDTDLAITTVDAGRIDADLIIISTQDAEIASVADGLLTRVASGASVLHTSGACSSDILAGLREVGCSVGSFHPLVAVSDEVCDDPFRDVYFCVEGDDAAVALAAGLARDLGGTSFTIEPDRKALYHAAAVMSSGHAVALFDVAVQTLAACGLSSENARDVLLPLVRSTTANLSRMPPEVALTGTFARADVETFEMHVRALDSGAPADVLAIYILLGRHSLDLARRRGVEEAKLAEFENALSIANGAFKC